MKRSPFYTALILLMAVLCLCGIALLVWGAAQQGPQPHLTPMMVPPQVHHG